MPLTCSDRRGSRLQHDAGHNSPYLSFNVPEETLAQPPSSAYHKDVCDLTASPFTGRNDSWLPLGFLVKNAYMPFMFSDWMGSLKDGNLKQKNSVPLLFFLFFKIGSKACTAYVPALYHSNKVPLSSLSCWTGFLLFLLPSPGTGCTLYLWTATQWR